MSHQEFLWKTLDTVNKWVTQADAKAVALLAADGVISGMIFVRLGDIITALRPHCCLSFLGGLGLLGLILSIFFAIRCVLPRLSADAPQSITFFRHISQLSIVEYEAKLKAMLGNNELLQAELAYQVWANSKIATRKYRCVSLSIWSATSSLILFLVVIILYYGGAQ